MNKGKNSKSETKGCEIAIIGLSCRFPGGGNSPEKFWDALDAGQSGIREIPPERWDASQFYHPDPAAAGRYYPKRAGTLENIAGFDAEFFGISPREAEEMDPQQRLLLELAWESLERAGIPPEQIAGTNCAVYVGISATDYGNVRTVDLGGSSRYTLAGASLSIAANRISHFFDLRGTSMSIDTACSSALVALNEAVQSLQDERAEMALVGGVNMLISPYPFIGLSRATMLSDYGECRAFAKMAKGYVRAEGGGMVVLKPLARALADGDPIAAVIRGCGINNDGRTPGLSFPSSQQQETLLRSVYDQFDLNPEDLVYLEAHGVGTAVGDPIEAQAIGRAIGQRRAKKSLPIGSVKTNIGHLESASGIAGLIKAVGILKRRKIPPSLHARELNPDIPFDELNIRVVQDGEAVPLTERPAIVGVNSFGFGGTNAHVVLEEYRGEEAPAPKEAKLASPLELPLTARTEVALRKVAEQVAARLEQEGVSLRDLAYTTALHRTHHGRRLLVRAEGPEQAAKSLRRYVAGQPDEFLTHGASIMRNPRVVFIFAGHGAQGTEEGLRLMIQDPLLAPQMRRVDEIVKATRGWSIIDQINLPPERRIVPPVVLTQLLSFPIQAGLMKGLVENGLRPDAVTGHSFGEIPAAWAAEVLTFEQAIHLILERSVTQEVAFGKGMMAAASLDVFRAEREILRYNGLVEIATVNSPSAVTFVGDAHSLNDLGQRLAAQGVVYRMLDLEYAFHSRFLDAGGDALKCSLADLKPSSGTYPFYSSVTGKREVGENLNGEYWWRNMRCCVRFDQAMAALIADRHAIFIEIGCYPIMQAYVRHSLRALNAPGQPLCVIVRQTSNGAARRVSETVAKAYTLGAKIDWRQSQFHGGKLVELPDYPWERENFWFPLTTEAKGPLSQRSEGGFLGVRFDPEAMVWESIIDTHLHPLLADHRIGENIVFPTSGYVELALEAAAAMQGDGPKEIDLLQVHHPMVLQAGKSRRLAVRFSGTDNTLKIESRLRLSDDAWALHATARIVKANHSHLPPLPALSDVPGRGKLITGSQHDEVMESLGLHHGPAFRLVESVTIKKRFAEAVLHAPEGNADFKVHPATLENVWRILPDILQSEERDAEKLAFLPRQIERALFHQTNVPVSRCRVFLKQRSQRSAVVDFDLLDGEGGLVASLRGVRFQGEMLEAPRASVPRYHAMEYVPLEMGGKGPELPSAAVWAGIVSESECLAVDLNALVGPMANEKPFSPGWKNLVELHPELLAELLLAGNGQALKKDVVHTTRERMEMLLNMASTFRALDDLTKYTLQALAKRLPGVRKLQVLELASQEWMNSLVIDGDRFAHLRLSSSDASRGDVNNGFDPSAPFAENELLRDKQFDLMLLRHPAWFGPTLPNVLAQAGKLLAPNGRLIFVSYGAGAWSDLAFGKNALPTAPAWKAMLENAGLEHATVVPASAGYFAVAEMPGQGRKITGATRPDHIAVNWLIAKGDSPVEDSLAHDLAIHLVEAGHDVTFLYDEKGWQMNDLEIGFDFKDPAAWRRMLDETRKTGPRGVIYLNGISVVQGNMRAIDDATWPITCMAQAMAMVSDVAPPAIVLVTAGAHSPPAAMAIASAQKSPHQAATWGLARVLRNEHPDWKCRVIDLHTTGDFENIGRSLAEEILTKDAEDEVIRGVDRRIGLRVRTTAGPDTASSVRPESFLLENDRDGEGLAWKPQPLPKPSRGEIQIEVKAVGLNFRDVMYSLGMLPEEMLENGLTSATLGMEGAGVITAAGPGAKKFSVGEKVYFFAPSSFATHVVTSQNAVAAMPLDLDFSAAATIPTAFFTITYALAHLTRLKAKERILIHGAVGGVGLAAIQYARHVGAEIFATVGSQEKRHLLRLMGVPENRIFDSRSLSFADDILAVTGGEGVDVVLNSLAGEAVEKGLSLLRPFGRFVELGKRDFYTNSTVGLRPFRNNLSYYGVDSDQVLKVNPRLRARIFRDMAALFSKGAFKPLPFRIFQAEEVAEAFHQMQHGRHMGKIVVLPPALERPAANPPAPGVRLDPMASYLITGGSSGLGLASAEVLARLGARRLILLGRKNLSGDAVRETVESLAKQGVQVERKVCDLSKPGSVSSVVAELTAEGHRIRGVIHAATAYEDGPIVSMTAGQFKKVVAVKAGAALELRQVFADEPLDFFVLYSSISAVVGNPGQGNYAAANAVLDALDAVGGKSTLSIAWGAISDLGYLARETGLRDAFEERFGIRIMPGEDALAELEQCLTQGLRGRIMIGELDWGVPSLRVGCGVTRHARFREMAVALSEETVDSSDIRARIVNLSHDQIFDLTLELLTEQISEVLRISAEKIGCEQSIAETGMDSLTTMELRILLERRFGFELPILMIREGVTIRQLAERIRNFLIEAPAEKPPADENLTLLAVKHGISIETVAAGLVNPPAPEELESGNRPLIHE